MTWKATAAATEFDGRRAQQGIWPCRLAGGRRPWTQGHECDGVVSEGCTAGGQLRSGTGHEPITVELCIETNCRPEEKETQHWLAAMKQTREVMAEHAPATRCWFQLDREGDAWPVLKDAGLGEHWFTIRARRKRRVLMPDGAKAYLWPLLKQQPVKTTTPSRCALPGGVNRAERKWWCAHAR